MAAKFCSQIDGSRFRHVIMPTEDEPQTPPKCCAYSCDGKCLPCWHGESVIRGEHGYPNMHKLVHNSNLIATWKMVYDTSFPILSQTDVAVFWTRAKLIVINGENFQVTKALLPPRGRPCKNVGKRKEGFYERGPTAKKMRSYSCSLCGRNGHVSSECSYLQVSGD